jgi:hypothetical protein
MERPKSAIAEPKVPPMETVDTMIRIKHILQTTDVSTQTSEYHEILKMVNEYIQKYCIHHVVYDDIDISPNESRKIRYCEYCEESFPM